MTYHYRFVMARRSGLLELGTAFYDHPLARGDAVSLDEPPDSTPETPAVTPVPARYVVEQLDHPLTLGVPPSRGVSTTVTVYVQLLDEAGLLVASPDHGLAPGLFRRIHTNADVG